jgi:hypothetical protein
MGTILDKAHLVITPNGIKALKLYSIKPSDGSMDMKVLRSSIATLINSDGTMSTVADQVPRLDYSNGTPGILAECQTTNLCLRSNEFTNAYWVKTGTTVAQSTTVDFLTGEKTYLLAETISTGIHTITSSNIPVQQYLPYVASCFLKKGSGANAPNIIRLVLGVSWVNFNISTGEVLSSSGGQMTGYTKAYANGWYRCTIFGDFISSDTDKTLRVQFTNNQDSLVSSIFLTYAGNVNANVFISGTQLENGNMSTSYIPTVGSTLLRRADQIDSGFVPGYYALTSYVDFYADSRYQGQYQPLVFEGGYSLYVVVEGLNAQVVSADTETSFSFSTTLPNYGRNKIVLKSVDSFSSQVKIFINGVYKGVLTDTVGAPDGQRIALSGFFNSNSTINSVLTFKEILSDAECIALTTL